MISIPPEKCKNFSKFYKLDLFEKKMFIRNSEKRSFILSPRVGCIPRLFEDYGSGFDRIGAFEISFMKYKSNQCVWFALSYIINQLVTGKT